MKTDTKAIRPLNAISNSNFEAAILATDKPVLLMCVTGGRIYVQQARVLKQLSDQYRTVVDICCLEEDFINGFKKMYGIKGTPVFLLFHKGEEKGRLLGMADKERLETFLARNLPLKAAPDKEAATEAKGVQI